MSLLGKLIGGAVSDLKHGAKQAAAEVKHDASAVEQAAQQAGQAAVKQAERAGETIEHVASAEFRNAEASVKHAGDTLTKLAGDAFSGVKGAFDSLKAFAKGLNPADLIKLVDGELAQIQQQGDVLFGPGLDVKGYLSSVNIPRQGFVANLFPARLRGSVVHWADARKTAAGVVWYLSALSLVDATALKNEVLKKFKQAIPFDRGFEPITMTAAGVAQNLPLIITVIVVCLVIAAIVIKTVAPPNTIAYKVASATESPLSKIANVLGVPIGQADDAPTMPAPPPPPVIVTQPPDDDLGHSNSLITYLTIGLFVVVTVAVVWLSFEDEPKK